MIDLGRIHFIQDHGEDEVIVHTIRGDSSLDEVIDSFEHFLKGAGYNLPLGCHIGYEYDEDYSAEIVSITGGSFGKEDDDGTRN